jgi:hypothetical protein
LPEQDFLGRIFGRCLAGDPIDREVSDVIRQGIPGVPKLFTYACYNPDLSREGLAALGLDHIRPEHVQQMDSVGLYQRDAGGRRSSRTALRRYEAAVRGFPTLTIRCSQDAEDSMFAESSKPSSAIRS